MEYVKYFVEGTAITAVISLVGEFIGILFGLLVAIGRIKRIPIISPLLTLYVSFIRSLPLLLLVMLLYFGIPAVGINLNPFIAAFMALGINDAAFTSEIWRSAIQDFPHDQIEAAKSVGMIPKQIFWRITLPQIWRSSIPALTNDITLLIKASPAVGIIGINDLTRRASTLGASTYEPLAMLAIATLIYVVVLFTFSRMSTVFDQHLQRQYELL